MVPSAAEAPTADGLAWRHSQSADVVVLLADLLEYPRQSILLAFLKTVYRDLDPEITNFADLPVGYEADAKRAGRRQVALAGYRLTEELKRITHSD